MKYFTMKNGLFLLAFLITFGGYSQRKKDKDDLYIINNDSLTIPLNEVLIFDKKHFNTAKERKYYYWYTKKVQKAWPYARLSSEYLVRINKQIEAIKSKRKKKKLVKRMQKYLEGEFTDELKNMTRTEGRILIKLIHRQTGMTLYTLIKEYRSGFKAFLYNTSAKVFKLDLKSEYHPETDLLDFLVEDILQRSFADEKLEFQPPKTPIDYFELKSRWKNISPYEVIDAYIKKYK